MDEIDTDRTLGGGGIHGYQITKDHKEKLRQATLAQWADPEHREKRLKAMHAATETAEYRAKISAAGKKNWANPDFKTLSLKRMQEGALNPESIEKRRASLRKAFQKPESKAKLSKACLFLIQKIVLYLFNSSNNSNGTE